MQEREESSSVGQETFDPSKTEDKTKTVRKTDMFLPSFIT